MKKGNMYKNLQNKKFDNCQKVYSSLDKNNQDLPNDNIDNSNNISNNNLIHDRFIIEKKINDILNSNDYIYKADVVIVLKDKTINKRIVGKSFNNLITIDNEYIPISIIRDIYKN